MTNEQREKIDRIKKKKVIANHENRKTISDMWVKNKLFLLQYITSSLMEGQMEQTGTINRAINNLMVEAENIKKKATKIAKESEE